MNELHSEIFHRIECFIGIMSDRKPKRTLVVDASNFRFIVMPILKKFMQNNKYQSYSLSNI